MGSGYTEDIPADFESAFERNERLRENDEAASGKEQQHMEERWQERQERRNGLSNEERLTIAERMQERKTKRDCMSDEERAVMKKTKRIGFGRNKPRAARSSIRPYNV